MSDYYIIFLSTLRFKEYERQIDQMIYQRYGLTPEKIAVVEGFTESKGIR